MTEKLIKIVKTMREAQKKFYRTRNYTDLNKAKQIEREVDILISELENSQKKLF